MESMVKLLGLVFLLTISACALPAAPSEAAPAPTHYLTVRVLQRSTEIPIANAQIFISNAPLNLSKTTRTDVNGEAVLKVPEGFEIRVHISHEHYPSSAVYAASVAADTTWTFHLL
jgi:hypothetical protein